MNTISLKRKSCEIIGNDSHAKQQKKGGQIEITNNKINEQKNLNGLSVISVLNDNRSQKTVFLHGKFQENLENDAVIILERKPFDTSSDALSKILSSKTELSVELLNDIYSTYSAQLPAELNRVKATIIYPATKKHLEKYRSQSITVLNETKSDYENFTKPFVEKQFADNVFNIQWVYNILDHKQESERIIFEDPDKDIGFILLPDMKWDVKDPDSLYVIAIPHKRRIKSLRDVTSEHLPLLRNIQKQSYDVIAKKFGVPRNALRMYFHYQPSYYHLHIHINLISLDLPGTGVLRAHLLCDVIQNLELCTDYYKNKTFAFTLRQNDKFLQEFQNYKNNKNM